MSKEAPSSERISLPEFLTYSTAPAASSRASCNVYQTTCPSCQGVPCQTGQCGFCQSACQCSSQSNQGCTSICEKVVQCGGCEDGCLAHECYQCGVCQDQHQGCGSCQTCLSCTASCHVQCQGCQTCQEICEGYCLSECEVVSQSQIKVSLSLTGGKAQLTWRISGLSASFTNRTYIRAGITAYQFTVGGVTSISGIKDYVNAGASGSTSVSNTISYEPGTYSLWGFAQTLDGKYWPAGSATVTVLPLKTRPNNWSWGYTVQPGARLPTALEWDNFCARVNQFREYSGLSSVGFQTVYPGPTELSAAAVNTVITAIRAMSPTVSPPASTVGGVTPFSAALLNGLANSLNSIP